MNTRQPAPSRVYIFSFAVLTLVVLAFALYEKGDVKAVIKMLGLEFSIETKDHAASH
jgi:hypothetical protein